MVSEDVTKLLDRMERERADGLKSQEEKNYSAEIRKKKEELELKKLEIEISKLSTPTTSVDYFQQLINMQNANFQQLLSMQTKQHETDLKLARLEAGGEDGNDWIMDLLPMLPEILKARTAAPQSAAPQVAPQITPPPFAQIEKEGNNMKIPNAAEIAIYKAKIKAGEISAEEFYNDAVASYPDLAKKVSKETILAEYEKFKNS